MCRPPKVVGTFHVPSTRNLGKSLPANSTAEHAYTFCRLYRISDPRGNLKPIMEYEKTNEPLLSRQRFYIRLANSFGVTLLIVGFSLAFGTAGYCYFGELEWVDGLLNATMILTGMGPVDRVGTTSGKLFAVIYALYSGIAFLSMIAILMTPIVHRFLHKFHLEDD